MYYCIMSSLILSIRIIELIINGRYRTNSNNKLYQICTSYIKAGFKENTIFRDEDISVLIEMNDLSTCVA